MKSFKKLAGLALAMIMALALMAPAMAAETGTNTITITNAEKGATYTLYKIFDAKVIADRPSNEADGITYQLTSGTTMPTQLAEVFELDTEKGTIKAITGKNEADIMVAVKAYAVATPSAQVGEPVTNTKGGAVEFTGLDDGYYAVLSNVSNGASVTITSIAPNARVIEKNSENIDPDPKNSTKTLVDANGTTLTDKTVSIGETIYYMVKTTAANWVDKNKDTSDGAEYKITSYTVKDNGADFLTDLKIDSITVVAPDGTKTSVTGFGSNVTTYQIPWVNDEGNHLYVSGSEIQVMYSATVNASIIGATNARNAGWITPNGYTEPDEPDQPHEDVFTYGFGLVKTTGANNAVLDGAKFELYDGNTDTAKKIDVVAVAGEANTYRVAEAGETGVKIEAGNVVIKGLANGTYYLKETDAPNGYNAIDGYTDGVTISNTDNLATVTDGAWVSGGIHVVNNAGTVLPDTGGIGTTIFYTLGGLLLVGSVILFVTKKRTGMAD